MVGVVLGLCHPQYRKQQPQIPADIQKASSQPTTQGSDVTKWTGLLGKERITREGMHLPRGRLPKERTDVMG